MNNSALRPQLGKPPSSWTLGARLLASLAVLVGVASACSEAASPPGYREYAPVGGSGGGGGAGTAGTMITSGEGGEPAAGGTPDGGEPTQQGGAGGSSSVGGAAAGKGGGGGGGGAAGGAPATTCGNGTKDPGEDCDDGNLLDFDGCSSVCKAKCESCLDTFYGGTEDYEFFLDLYRNSMVPALEGPAQGVARSKLAQDLARCIVKSECILNDPIPQGACLCGTASNVECEAEKSDSPCLAAFGSAAEGKDYATITARLTNFTLAVGWAVELTLLQGSRGYCVNACKEEREVTPCERCLAGPTPVFDPPQDGCTACLIPGSCSTELLSCVEEKCADGDLEPCLKQPTDNDDLTQPWPCRDAAIAASVQFGATVGFARCRASQCKVECASP